MENIKLCNLSDCTRRHLAKGLCARHYQQVKKYGKTLESTIYDKRNGIVEGNIVKIPLNVNAKDGFAIVDKNFKYLEKHKWSLGKNGYPSANIAGAYTPLHKLVLPRKKGMFVDHINGDKLDNRSLNLRHVTPRQSVWNTRSRKNKTGYKGVYFHKQNNNWVARVNYKHIGVFDTAESAALAYNKIALRLYGEFAALNKLGQ